MKGQHIKEERGNSPGERHHWEGHEKQEADDGHDSVKNQKRKKRALVCLQWRQRDTQRDSARHLRTMPLML